MRSALLIVSALILCSVSSTLATGWLDECLFVRQYDGSCNNPFNFDLGKGDRYLGRGAEGVWFADGVREPIMTPNPRTVSNNLFRADDSIVDPDGHNLLWVFFGQFVAHDLMGVHRIGDINKTEIQDTSNPNLWLNVPLEHSNDAFYFLVPPIPQNFMRVLRSRGDIVNNRFEVGSDSTAYLDLDTVYGKTEAVAALLRANTNGLLATRNYVNYTAAAGSAIPVSQVGTWGEWLPLINDVDPARTTIPISPQLVGAATVNVPLRFFATGDGRNGENYALNMFQGLFVRNHNRLARQIKQQHPFWPDELIFQAARRQNIAAYQAIVFYEYLPSVLLNDFAHVGHYHGYDHEVDPTVSQLFAFAFRFGHTTVPNLYYYKNECHVRPFNSTRDGPRSGQQSAQFMPADFIAQAQKPENILHAILYDSARRVDPQFPESLRSIRGANTDIVVQNQVRAAENGIPGYHTIRKLWYGGPHSNLYNRPGCSSADENTPAPDPIECFNYITANSTVAEGLQALYGKITNINFYTAVVCEDPTQSAIGRTSARIVADQFRRARDGDRWWFESEWAGFTPREVRQFKRIQLHDILRANFPNAHVQDNAFYVPADEDFFNGCN